MIRARAADVQFTVAMTDQSRIYNTFDAHRLLHWAELQGRHVPLKHELFRAYFTSGLSAADHDVLVSAAEKAGLEIGKHTSELQSLMRISYAVFCLKKKK